MAKYFLLLGQALLVFSLVVVKVRPSQWASFIPAPLSSCSRFIVSPRTSPMKRSRSSPHRSNAAEGTKRHSGGKWSASSSGRPSRRLPPQDSKGNAAEDASRPLAVVDGDELVSISRQLHDRLKGVIM